MTETDQGPSPSTVDNSVVPETLYRGERLYRHNFDELGKRALTTVGLERTGNQNGQVFLARDKDFATTYAIGTDGVRFYDDVLPASEIPIGVTYKVHNPGNVLEAKPTSDDPSDHYLPGHPMHGQFREFTTETVPPENYSVEEIHLMDDFDTRHVRSDARNIKETIRVEDHPDLDSAIAVAKARFDELEALRQQKIASGEYHK